jgi:protein involved in polysaccharide export with SLBB domain
MAGGFNQFAARTRVVVLRQEGDKKLRIPFNYNRVTTGGSEEENVYLRPGDIVLVP